MAKIDTARQTDGRKKGRTDVLTHLRKQQTKHPTNQPTHSLTYQTVIQQKKKKLAINDAKFGIFRTTNKQKRQKLKQSAFELALTFNHPASQPANPPSYSFNSMHAHTHITLCYVQV